MNDAEKLLEKYLHGNCTTAEKRQLYQHLLQHRAGDYEEVFQALWSELSEAPPPDPEVSERMYSSILKGSQLSTAPPLIKKPWAIAASVAGLVLLSGLLYYFFIDRTQVYETQFGEVKAVELPDGSQVHLNANSQLSFSSGLATDHHREVWLKGEAYFQVSNRQNSADQPIKLTVHTAQVDIEVLGTAFNVKDRHCITQVVLDKGSVRLISPKNEDELVAMSPGESVEVNREQSFQLKKIDDSVLASSWKENELYFNDQPLYEIQQILADNYGLQLRFADPELSQLRFTGSTPADDLTVLFSTLEKSFLLNITQNNDEYMVSRDP